MKRMIPMVLIPGLLLGLSGCGPSASRPVSTKEIVWAQTGTPARITDDEEVRVMVPDEKGGWQPAKASLKGMVAIDEPTLRYYQQLHASADADTDTDTQKERP